MFRKSKQRKDEEMNNLQVFNNQKFGEVRTLTINDEVWFVGKDVAECLGYSNTRDALLRHVDVLDKRPDVAFHDGSQNRTITVINESGLYALIFGSKLESAKEFKRWVTSEILPNVRKHGMYLSDEVLQSPDFLLQVATRYKEEYDKRIEAERIIEIQRPKVLFADAVETSESTCLIGELAKIISQNLPKKSAIGQNKLFEWLRQHGYLHKNKKDERYNLPQQRYIEQGLFKIKKRTINEPNGSVRVTSTTKVTGKGQQYFINKFMQRAIV